MGGLLRPREQRISDLSRCRAVLLAVHADMRSADDVIALEGHI